MSKSNVSNLFEALMLSFSAPGEYNAGLDDGLDEPEDPIECPRLQATLCNNLKATGEDFNTRRYDSSTAEQVRPTPVHPTPHSKLEARCNFRSFSQLVRVPAHRITVRVQCEHVLRTHSFPAIL